MRLLFKNLCPSCDGNITNEELIKGEGCSKCKHSISGKLKTHHELIHEYRAFSKFFKKCLKAEPTPLQKNWGIRVLKRQSFAIVAPTGVGKTSFGMIMALFLAMQKKRCYLLFPTSLLIQQTMNKLKSIDLKSKIRILAYHSALKQKEKDEVKEKLKNGEFDIVLSTDRFLFKNFELLKGKLFDFIFIDDVDSFLKSMRNVDLFFNLIGCPGNVSELSDEELEKLKPLHGTVVFSSATARARRTKKIKLLKKLLNFTFGFQAEFLRNIENLYVKGEIKQILPKLIKQLGGGCLLFVPTAKGLSFCKELENLLHKHGISAKLYGHQPEIIEEFKNGNIHVLIGIASYKSPLARGLDLPKAVRYALFAGVPRVEVELDPETYNPTILLIILKTLASFVEENQQVSVRKAIQLIKDIVPLSKEKIQAIQEGKFLYLRRKIEFAQRVLRRILTDDLIKRIESAKDVRLKHEDKKLKLIVADPVGYLQASGRTSRLYIGGMTKGLSIVIVDDEKAFYGLEQKISLFVEEEFKPMEQANIKKILDEVDKDRLELPKRKGKAEFMKTYLLIVESPTKARTIARFFGKPVRRKLESTEIFEIATPTAVVSITASLGHLLDLVETEGFDGVNIKKKNSHIDFTPIYATIKKCKSCGEQFVGFQTCPKCKSKEILDKRSLIDDLQSLAEEVDAVLLGTDPDIEGEKISYDLFCFLKPFNSTVERIEFHEVTRKAIKKALEERRKINTSLVEAQIVRRIEDRWIGFELSKILWRYFNDKTLSAGRVQTPVLGWVIERTAKAKKKIPIATVSTACGTFLFRNLETKNLKNYKTVKIQVTDKTDKINPPPPFTTDTLLRESNKVLKFSAEKTMRLAQELFESGLITYHRTDSVHVSDAGINLAKNYLANKNLEHLFKPRRFGKEGTHESIRPTKPIDVRDLRNLITQGVFHLPLIKNEHFRLYSLIFNRFISSQCKPAKVRKQIIVAELNDYSSEQERIVELIEEGFIHFTKIKVYPSLKSGEYNITSIKVKYIPEAHPYSQGDIISLMKEKNIGRPSTYSKIVQTLIERRYIVEKNLFLFSTRRGQAIFNFLTSNFKPYVSENFTRKLEAEIDAIEQRKISPESVLQALYDEIKNISKLFVDEKIRK